MIQKPLAPDKPEKDMPQVGVSTPGPKFRKLFESDATALTMPSVEGPGNVQRHPAGSGRFSTKEIQRGYRKL